MMIVSIQGHQYQMSKTKYKQYINKIKKMIPSEPTIIAVEKPGYAEMRNDVFQSQKMLNEAVKQWHDKGFTVKFIRGSRNN